MKLHSSLWAASPSLSSETPVEDQAVLPVSTCGCPWSDIPLILAPPIFNLLPQLDNLLVMHLHGHMHYPAGGMEGGWVDVDGRACSPPPSAQQLQPSSKVRAAAFHLPWWMDFALLGKQLEGMLCSADTSPRVCCLSGRRENTLLEYWAFNKWSNKSALPPRNTSALIRQREAERRCSSLRCPRCCKETVGEWEARGFPGSLSRAGWDCGACQGGGAAAAAAAAAAAPPVRAPPRAGRSRGVLLHSRVTQLPVTAVALAVPHLGLPLGTAPGAGCAAWAPPGPRRTRAALRSGGCAAPGGAPAADSPPAAPQAQPPVSAPGGMVVGARGHPWPPAPRPACAQRRTARTAFRTRSPVSWMGEWVIPMPSLLRDFQWLYTMQARRFSQKKAPLFIF